MRKSIVSISSLILMMLMTLVVRAQEIVPGWESYLSRPDIFEMSPSTEIDSMDADWAQMREAHFGFLAQLFVMYPEHEIYFLARDSELLYDAAKLATFGTPKYSKVHLLNVSRANMNDEYIEDYLQENGIDEMSLLAGKKVLFVDTGFSGTIPTTIAKLFSPEANRNFQTHLILSENVHFPSSHVFLSYFRPDVFTASKKDLHASIIKYEHMPRYFYRSTRYMKKDKRWHPLSPVNDTIYDGDVSKTQAVKYMKSLRAFWDVKTNRDKFSTLLSIFRQFQSLIDKLEKTEDLLQVRDFISKHPSHSLLLKSYVVDVNRKNRWKNSLLSNYADSFTGQVNNPTMNKLDMVDAMPELGKYILDPVIGIKLLVDNQDWVALKKLFGFKLDVELVENIWRNLFKTAASSPEALELQIEFVEKYINPSNEFQFSSFLANDVSNDEKLKMFNFFKKYLEKHHGGGKGLNKRDLLRSLNVMNSNNQKPTLLHVIKTTEQKNDLIQILNQCFDSLTFGLYFLPQPEAVQYPDFFWKVARTEPERAIHAFEHSFWRNQFSVMRKFIEEASIEPQAFQKTLTYVLRGSPLTSNEKVLMVAAGMPQKSRKDFLDKNLKPEDEVVKPKISEKIPDPVVTVASPIGPNLKDNSVVVIENQRYTVVRQVGQGRRGVVFKLINSKGQVFALKVAKNQDAETLESIAKEPVRMEKLAAINIPISRILATGSNFILKEWIEGITGEEVLKRYEAGDPKAAEARETLLAMVRDLKSRGIYVGDFRPPNLLWTGKGWVLVDGGSPQKSQDDEKISSKWAEKFPRRWKIPIEKIETPRCDQVFL